MSDTIAFLGTGLLGAAFVEAACGRGDHVTVWNRTAAKAQALQSFGAQVATTPGEAVRGATRVHLVLPDDVVVEDVIARLRDDLAPAAVIVDHSTTLPRATALRGARLNAEGVRYLHCPVFIGPSMAREAQGIILCSGPQALYDAVAPALARQATTVRYLGERPDLAAVHKLCGNAMLLGLAGVVADVFSVAAGSGVAPAEGLAVLEYFDPGKILSGRGRKMAAGDFSASFELAMARKDFRLMIESAGDLPLSVLPGMAARMDDLIARGLGQQDAGVVAVDAYEAWRKADAT